MMKMLYDILKTAKIGAGKAPDLYTALLAKNLRRNGEAETLSGIPPLTFPSNGQPITSWSLKGNESHTGTPTPDSPAMPQGTGERTGNLLDFEQLKTAPSGRIGTVYAPHLLTLQMKPNTYYTMASNGYGSIDVNPSDLYRSIYVNRSNGEYSVNKSNPVTVLTDDSGNVNIGFFDNRTNGQQYLNGEAQVWINEGSTALPYEPYGYKIPISSANTTTPVYLGEVESTRKIKKLVLTGDINEDWKAHQTISSWYQLSITDIIIENLEICTHYQASLNSPSTIQNNEILVVTQYQSVQGRIIIRDTSCATVEDFKAYLAQQYTNGTPVTVWYVLATPTTGIVNEPLMKIGDYADELSNAVSIPTVRGENTLSIGTTVQPSEMTIKYYK